VPGAAVFAGCGLRGWARGGAAFAVLFLAACGYGPPEPRATVEQVVRLGDSGRAVVLVRHDIVRRPTGLGAFPDGGRWRFDARASLEYLVEARSREIRLLARQDAGYEVWQSFAAHLVGVEADTVAWLRVTGCPRGGECHPDLQRSLAYRLSLTGGATPVEAVPPDATLPAQRLGRRVDEIDYVRFTTRGDTVAARFTEGGEWEALFRLAPDGNLVPIAR
jgi:hypothetical protein